MSKKPKLTPWFPANVMPAREGVYQRRTPGAVEFGYGHWNGRHWGAFNITPMGALVDAYSHTSYLDDEWRGLAADPINAGRTSNLT